MIQSASHAGDKIVLSAETKLPKLISRHSLVYAEEKTILAVNSNSLCGPTKEVALGLFEKKQDSVQKGHRELLKQISNRIRSQDQGLNEVASPHATRYFLGENDLSNKEGARATVKRYISESCGRRDWIAKKAVIVDIVRLKGQEFLRQRSIVDDKQVAMSITPLERTSCDSFGDIEKGNKVLDCSISGYGVARLIAGQ